MADRLGYKATAAGSQAYRHSTGPATEPLPRVYRLTGTQPAPLQSHCRGFTDLQALNRLGWRATSRDLHACRQRTGSATEPLRRIYMLADSEPAPLQSHPGEFADVPNCCLPRLAMLRCLSPKTGTSYKVTRRLKHLRPSPTFHPNVTGALPGVAWFDVLMLLYCRIVTLFTNFNIAEIIHKERCPHGFGNADN